MKLTVFGNNASWPDPDGACACYLVQTDDAHILLDMGSGSLAKLQHRVDVAELDLIVISHLHFDHMGDLFCAKYQLETRRAMGEKIHPIPLAIPQLPRYLEEQLREGGVFEFITIKDGAVYDNPSLRFSIQFYAMRHLIESYGMRLFCKGNVLAYSGDTAYCENLRTVALQADGFLCEASLAEEAGEAAQHHLSAPKALEVAMQAGAKRLILTHYHSTDMAKLQVTVRKGVEKYNMAVSVSKIMETFEI